MMTGDLAGFEIYGSKFININKSVKSVKVICFVDSRRLVVPIEWTKKSAEDLVTCLENLTKEEYLILPG